MYRKKDKMGPNHPSFWGRSWEGNSQKVRVTSRLNSWVAGTHNTWGVFLKRQTFKIYLYYLLISKSMPRMLCMLLQVTWRGEYVLQKFLLQYSLLSLQQTSFFATYYLVDNITPRDDWETEDTNGPWPDRAWAQTPESPCLQHQLGAPNPSVCGLDPEKWRAGQWLPASLSFAPTSDPRPSEKARSAHRPVS